MSEDVIQPTDLDRLWSSFRKLVRSEFPQLTYMGIWEYAVEATDGTTIDCSPTDTAIPLPSLAKVPMLSGLMGEIAPAVVGKRCVVVFLNGDPTKARIISVDGATEHVMTLEATVLLIYNVFYQYTLLGTAIPIANQPFIAAIISAALTAQVVPAPPGFIAQQVANAAITSSMASGTVPSNALGPLAAPIAALVPKIPDVSGLFPGLGATK